MSDPPVLRTEDERLRTALQLLVHRAGEELGGFHPVVTLAEEILEMVPAHETGGQRTQDERTLRRLLAFAYSGSALYGDDGELQDGCHPMIDYVRDSVADIERKIHDRGMAKLAAAACPECRYVVGHKAGCSAQKALQQPPVLDRKVTVCDHCECACCWQGEFMCDEAKGAGTVDRSIRELLSHAHPRESCEYWFKSPNNGAIDQSGLDELRRYLEAKANAKGK